MKRKPRENVIEKIFIYSFPDWISIYDVSKKIYRRSDSYINEVVKKNKIYFEFNNKGQIRSKSDLLMKDMCNLADFTLDEQDSLKLLVDNDNFRRIIKYSKIDSIQEIWSLIKQIAVLLTEFRKIAKTYEFNEKRLLDFLESDLMKGKEQIIKKQMFLRIKGARDQWFLIKKNDLLLAISNFLSILDKSRSKNLIEKLSTLPVPIIESMSSVATASFIKCEI